MKIKNTFGFALLEVMVSALILIAGIAALAKYQIFLEKNTSLVKQRIEAVNLAQAKLEYFRAFQSIGTTGNGRAYDDIVTGSDSAITGTNATFTRSWIVTTSTSPEYKTIDMSVTWTDSSGTAQKVELVTIVSRTDPTWTGSIISNTTNI